MERQVRAPFGSPAALNLVCAAALAVLVAGPALSQDATTIFRNGTILTVDPQNRVVEAMAIKGGVIVAVGSQDEVSAAAGADAAVIDLQGKTLMPGLIDAHMHPMGGGAQLTSCSLNYAPLTVDETLAAITVCLDEMADKPADQWLQVQGWFRQAMLPAGADLSAEILDRLPTERPVLVFGSDFHSLAANSRAIAAAGITAETPDPEDGVISRDSSGQMTGVFLDGAMWILAGAVPPLPAEEADAEAAAQLTAALREMASQGITSIFDAASGPDAMAQFSRFADDGALTVRATLAPVFGPPDLEAPDKIVADIAALAQDFAREDTAESPGVAVRSAKIFLDGVIQAPAQTGALLEPYLVNHGDHDHADWKPGDNLGELYVPEDTLTAAMTALAREGLDVHLHTTGDRAVNSALNAIERTRATVPDADFRPALAHCELMHSADFARFAQLDALPVLQFQWAKPSFDTITSVKDYIGEERFKLLETAGKFAQAGARVAYGSDWPIDPLDHWFAMEVALTRMGENPDFPGRLGDDPGLDITTALRAFTINAAFSLRSEQQVGSLEPGKFADFIILDRDPTQIAAEEISETKVLETWLGGRLVYAAAP